MNDGKKPLEIVNPAKLWTPDDPNDSEDVKEAMHKIQERVEEIVNRGKPELTKPGSTGQQPENKITPKDLGEIKIMVGIKQDTVIINFGVEVAWVGMSVNQAIDLGNMLLKAARHINKKG